LGSHGVGTKGGRQIDEEKRKPSLAFESGKENLEFLASVSVENLGFASMASGVEVELGGVNDGDLGFTGRNSIDHVRILLLRENNQDRLGLQHKHLAGVQVKVERRCTNFRFYTNSPRQYHHPIFTSSYNITTRSVCAGQNKGTGVLVRNVPVAALADSERSRLRTDGRT
jgi:hypothetical protein